MDPLEQRPWNSPGYVPVVLDENILLPGVSLRSRQPCHVTFFVSQGQKVAAFVRVIKNLIFQFVDGRDETTNATLKWTPEEKAHFMETTQKQIMEAWNKGDNLIKADPPLPHVPHIVVVFDVSPYDHEEKHVPSVAWIKLKVVKVLENDDVQSSVETHTPYGLLDSNDTQYRTPGTSAVVQRPVVHEFGHMLGLGDEYPRTPGGVVENQWWRDDEDSVMHLGEEIRPRHLTPFAAWLSLDEVQAESELYLNPKPLPKKRQSGCGCEIVVGAAESRESHWTKRLYYVEGPDGSRWTLDREARRRSSDVYLDPHLEPSP